MRMLRETAFAKVSYKGDHLGFVSYLVNGMSVGYRTGIPGGGIRAHLRQV